MLKDEGHWRSETYDFPIKNPDYWSHIQFDMNQDLNIKEPATQTFLTIFFWMGGWFAFMFTIGYFLSSLVYPHLAYMSVVLRLFSVDQSKGNIPRDPLAVERATPQDLLLAA